MLGWRRMETVKLRRGPKPGYAQIAQYSDRVMVAKPKHTMAEALREDPDPMEPVMVYGHYQRTNIKTQHGYGVFEWMGWEGETIGR
jgi:hypothetical protein